MSYLGKPPANSVWVWDGSKWVGLPYGAGTIVFQEEGSTVGTRAKVNFVGSGVTAVDNPGQNRVDVTIAGARVLYPFVNSTRSSFAIPANPEIIGAVYYDPQTIIAGTRSVTFQAILECSQGGLTATIDLYDFSGIIAAPAIVASSTLTTSAISPTLLTVSVPALATTSSSGILEARLRISTLGDLNFATCKGAELIVTFP